MNRIKVISLCVIFCLVIGVFSVSQWILPDEELSLAERREKQQFPVLSISTLADGTFSKELESYLCDQFPLREEFRKLKAFVHFDILKQKDNDGVYTAEGHISEFEERISISSVNRFCSRITAIYDSFIKNSDCKAYYCIVPDKNRFIAKQNGYPGYDYEDLYSRVDEQLSYMNKVEIDSLLSSDCYYLTDSHWRQEKILHVAKRINEQMGMKFNEENKEVHATSFYGVYYPRLAVDFKADELICIENETILGSTAYNYETDETTGVYNTGKLSGNDAYDVFLSGAVSVIEIRNPSGYKEKELVIFRDSFGSSLAPLILSNYSKVTLVDTRYIVPENIDDYVSFDKQDILFVYSTTLINKSITLK